MSITRRVVLTVGGIAAYRIGQHVPLPGFDADARAAAWERQIDASLLGQSLGHFLGAAVIFEALRLVVARLESIPHEGSQSPARIRRSTTAIALLLAFVQTWSVASLVALNGGDRLLAALSSCAGVAILIMVADMISERGVGNGFVVLVFAKDSYTIAHEMLRSGETAMALSRDVWFGILVLLTVALVVWMAFSEQARLLVPVCFLSSADRSEGQSQVLPLQLGTVGVYQFVLASAVLQFPATLVSWLPWLRPLNDLVSMGGVLYLALYATLVSTFGVLLYVANGSPMDLADTLKQRGGWIPGLRPGRETAEWLDRLQFRLTLVRSLSMAAVASLYIQAAIWLGVTPVSSTLVLQTVVAGVTLSFPALEALRGRRGDAALTRQVEAAGG